MKQLCYICQEPKEVNYDWVCEDCRDEVEPTK